jgi:hypothetical protein
MADTPLNLSNTLFSLQTVQSALLTSLGSNVMTGTVQVTLWPSLQCYRQTRYINKTQSLSFQSLLLLIFVIVFVPAAKVLHCDRYRAVERVAVVFRVRDLTALNIGYHDLRKTMKISVTSRIQGFKRICVHILTSNINFVIDCYKGMSALWR